MAKPRVKVIPYAIYYTDGSYMIYDLTRQDFDALTYGITEQQPVNLTVGFLSTKDIRAVIEQKPQETKQVKKERIAAPEMTLEDMQYLKGILGEYYEEDDIN